MQKGLTEVKATTKPEENQNESDNLNLEITSLEQTRDMYLEGSRKLPLSENGKNLLLDCLIKLSHLYFKKGDHKAVNSSCAKFLVVIRASLNTSLDPSLLKQRKDLCRQLCALKESLCADPNVGKIRRVEYSLDIIDLKFRFLRDEEEHNIVKRLKDLKPIMVKYGKIRLSDWLQDMNNISFASNTMFYINLYRSCVQALSVSFPNTPELTPLNELFESIKIRIPVLITPDFASANESPTETKVEAFLTKAKEKFNVAKDLVKTDESAAFRSFNESKDFFQQAYAVNTLLFTKSDGQLWADCLFEMSMLTICNDRAAASKTSKECLKLMRKEEFYPLGERGHVYYQRWYDAKLFSLLAPEFFEEKSPEYAKHNIEYVQIALGLVDLLSRNLLKKEKSVREKNLIDHLNQVVPRMDLYVSEKMKCKALEPIDRIKSAENAVNFINLFLKNLKLFKARLTNTDNINLDDLSLKLMEALDKLAIMQLPGTILLFPEKPPKKTGKPTALDKAAIPAPSEELINVKKYMQMQGLAVSNWSMQEVEVEMEALQALKDNVNIMKLTDKIAQISRLEHGYDILKQRSINLDSFWNAADDKAVTKIQLEQNRNGIKNFKKELSDLRKNISTCIQDIENIRLRDQELKKIAKEKQNLIDSIANGYKALSPMLDQLKLLRQEIANQQSKLKLLFKEHKEVKELGLEQKNFNEIINKLDKNDIVPFSNDQLEKISLEELRKHKDAFDKTQQELPQQLKQAQDSLAHLEGLKLKIRTTVRIANLVIEALPSDQSMQFKSLTGVSLWRGKILYEQERKHYEFLVNRYHLMAAEIKEDYQELRRLHQELTQFKNDLLILNRKPNINSDEIDKEFQSFDALNNFYKQECANVARKAAVVKELHEHFMSYYKWLFQDDTRISFWSFAPPHEEVSVASIQPVCKPF